MKKKWGNIKSQSMNIYHQKLAQYFLAQGRNEMRTAHALTRQFTELRDAERLLTFFREDGRAKWIQDTQKSNILMVCLKNMDLKKH